MRKKLVILFIVVALLIGVFTVAYAATGTKKQCVSYYSGGAKVAQLCAKATFTWSGTNMRCSNPSVTKRFYASGWSASTKHIYCSPTVYTAGYAGVVGQWDVKKNGAIKATKTAMKACDARNSVAYCYGSTQ
jgi:hypothetical protein